jgi:hypothetical protein
MTAPWSPLMGYLMSHYYRRRHWKLLQLLTVKPQMWVLGHHLCQRRLSAPGLPISLNQEAETLASLRLHPPLTQPFPHMWALPCPM